MRRTLALSALAATLLAPPAALHAQPAPLRSLERALAAQPSATAALTEWCGERRIADPATIVAERLAGEHPGSPAAVRTLLGAGEEPVAHRHVRLKCGETALSVAYNWYVPSRLSAEMNAALEDGNTPFGTVVAPLGFTRQNLARVRGAMNGCPKDSVLSHLALLKLPDGRPFSALIECYTAAALRAGGGRAP